MKERQKEIEELAELLYDIEYDLYPKSETVLWKDIPSSEKGDYISRAQGVIDEGYSRHPQLLPLDENKIYELIKSFGSFWEGELKDYAVDRTAYKPLAKAICQKFGQISEASNKPKVPTDCNAYECGVPGKESQ